MTIYYSNLDYESIERFDLAKFLEFNIDNFDILNSFFMVEFLKLPYVGNFVIQNEEQAPDYISKKLYGKHEYWWLIMYYNGVTDYKRLKSGTVLKYFSISDLESLYFKLKSLEVLKGTSEAIASTNNVATTSNSSVDKNYVFTQTILLSVWVIKHPLKKRPSVTILVKNGDGDDEEVDASIIYPRGEEDSKVIISFNTPTRGKVVLN